MTEPVNVKNFELNDYIKPLQKYRSELTRIAVATIAAFGFTLFFNTTHTIRAAVCLLSAAATAAIEIVKTQFLPKPEPVKVPSKPPRELINYEKLSDVAITLENIEKYEREISQGNFESYIKFLETILDSNTLLDTLLAANMREWLLDSIEKLLEKKGLSDELCERIHDKFCAYRIFWKETNFTLSAEDKIKEEVHTVAILLASPYARKLYYSNYADGKKQKEMVVANCSKEALRDFRIYVDSKVIHTSNSLKIFEDLLNVARLFEMEDLEKMVIRSLENFSALTVKDEKHLYAFLDEHQNLVKVLDNPELAFKLMCKGISRFMEYAYGSIKPFALTEEVFTLPINALQYLAKDDALGEFLRERVNTVSLPRNANIENLEKLKLLKTQLPKETFDKLTHLAIDFTPVRTDSGFNLHHPFSFDEEILKGVFSEFPQIKTVYITPSIIWEGYGLSPDAIVSFKQKFSDKKLVLMLDSSCMPFVYEKARIVVHDETQHQTIYDMFTNVELAGFSKTALEVEMRIFSKEGLYDDAIQTFLRGRYKDLNLTCEHVRNDAVIKLAPGV